MELGESAEDCNRREIREEISLELKNLLTEIPEHTNPYIKEKLIELGPKLRGILQGTK